MSNDDIVLKSGRILTPNGRIIGISPDYRPYGGYDQSLVDDWDDKNPLTPDEKRQISDMMIRRWVMFRE